MSWRYFNKSTPTMERMYRIILAPVITEKATLAGEHGQVVFKVANDATKPEIKSAIEKIFDVKVKADRRRCRHLSRIDRPDRKRS